MSIANESRQSETFVTETAADVLTSTGDCAVVWNVVRPITLLRIMELITTIVSSSADAVVYFDRRVLTDSDTGRLLGLNGTTTVVGDGVLKIPTTTAVGKLVYKDVRVDLDPGDQIVVNVHTAATSTGGGRYYFEYINRHETPENCGDMVESA